MKARQAVGLRAGGCPTRMKRDGLARGHKRESTGKKGLLSFQVNGRKMRRKAIPHGAVWCIQRERASEQGLGGGRGKPQCAHSKLAQPAHQGDRGWAGPQNIGYSSGVGSQRFRLFHPPAPYVGRWAALSFG